MSAAPTACILVIGDEILSGRTQDTNIKYIATRLGELGIRLKECRVIPDVPAAIIDAVNACRATYTYVFTTGGIGPTHDDITTACIAQSFGRGVIRHPATERMLREYYGDTTNDARLKMSEMPDGPDVEMIQNAAYRTPSYRIGNVFVLAGIPAVCQAMFEATVPQLAGGEAMRSGHVDGFVREGDIAEALTAIQMRYPNVALGSYPSLRNERYFVSIVARSTDVVAINRALGEVEAMMRAHNGTPESTPAT